MNVPPKVVLPNGLATDNGDCELFTPPNMPVEALVAAAPVGALPKLKDVLAPPLPKPPNTEPVVAGLVVAVFVALPNIPPDEGDAVALPNKPPVLVLPVVVPKMLVVACCCG